MKVSDFSKVAQTYDLQMNLERDAMIGDYEGYPIVVKVLSASSRCMVELSVKQGEILPSSSMDDFFMQMKKKHSMIQCMEYVPFRIRMVLKVNPAHEGDITIMRQILDHAFSYLKGNHYRACCEHCGRDANLHCYELKEAPFILCHVCHDDLKKQTQALHEELSRNKESMLTGIIGAIFGCIVGAIIWIGMYHLQLPVAAAGIFIAFFTVWLYQLCYGRMCTAGFTLIYFMMIVTVTGCHYFGFIQDIYMTLRLEFSLTLQEAMMKAPMFLSSFDILMHLLLDYGTTLLMMSVTFAFMIYRINKERSVPYTLHDLEDLGLHITGMDT